MPPEGDVLLCAGDLLTINRHFSMAYSIEKVKVRGFRVRVRIRVRVRARARVRVRVRVRVRAWVELALG
jgi:hypothetical protein